MVILGGVTAQRETTIASATTGADGRFRFDGVDPPREGLLAAVLSEFHEDPRPSGVLPGTEITIRLRRMATIHGCVRAQATGAPLSGASVRAGESTGTTDVRGRYEVRTTLNRGEVWVEARCEGHAPHSLNVRSHGARVEVDFSLYPTGAVKVLVVDRESGVALAGARFRRSQGAALAQTGPDGRTTLDGGEGQHIHARVEARGYCPLTWSWEVASPGEREVRIPLQRAACVEGRITDADGAPIRDANVTARNATSRSQPRALPEAEHARLPGQAYDELPDHAAQTDADGRYVLAVLPDAKPCVVSARHADHVEADAAPIVLANGGDRARVDLQLSRGAAVRGTARCNDRAWRGSVLWSVPGTQGFGGVARTADNGAFVLRSVTPGTVVLTLREDLGRTVQTATLQLAAGQELRHDFAWEEPMSTIRGCVTWSTGGPIAEQLVEALTVGGKDHRHYTARTDADGNYSLECGDGDTYTIGARIGEVTRQREAPAGATGVDLVLPDLGVLRLRLVDATTRAAVRPAGQDLHSLAWREQGAPWFEGARGKIDTTGLVEVRLPIGRVDVSLHLLESGYCPRIIAGLPVTGDAKSPPIVVELQRGVTVELEVCGDAPFDEHARKDHLVFLLESGQLAAVRGPFRDQGGESNHRINGVNMWLESPGLMLQMPSFDGRDVRLGGLAPGCYSLRSYPDDLVFEPASFVVGPAGGRITLRWRRR
ncbi:MAG TPA: carboxypeptidase-like regulatory domain-containing protein [Planctomycetota bacterium]|nr:carboxypeptidase-like regulatory domain-containing protein [Planctomycetota bacterium]